ncbi:MAG: 3-deoxy-manno-octulosonate cytidylyltransferase [bacterium]|nr:3-deoxy-manno-octulosonate cytidylyltransferase [bacterium]
MNPGAVAIVPVRVGSQRLPGKALLSESGRPLFLHTCEPAQAAALIDRVVVATDDDEVESAARAAGIEVARTSPDCRTGSERCAEAARALNCRAVLDIQGDWPDVTPADLDALAEQLLAGKAECNTLAAPLTDEARIADPNVVKVVRGRHGKALYFSRAAIPHRQNHGNNPDPADATAAPPMLRHIGVYGFTRDVLLRIPELPSSGLAETESLEQLRFLENDIQMHVLDAQGDPWGIENRADYDAWLARRTHR